MTKLTYPSQHEGFVLEEEMKENVSLVLKLNVLVEDRTKQTRMRQTDLRWCKFKKG